MSDKVVVTYVSVCTRVFNKSAFTTLHTTEAIAEFERNNMDPDFLYNQESATNYVSCIEL